MEFKQEGVERVLLPLTPIKGQAGQWDSRIMLLYLINQLIASFFSTYPQKSQPEINRVSKDNPCPICGKPDWCGIAEDGSFAVCMRIESFNPTENHGWLHVLNENHNYKPSNFKKTSRPKQKKSKVQIDTSYSKIRSPKVYNTLVDKLSLSDEHIEELINRGLTPDEAEKLKAEGYRTFPANAFQRMKIAQEINDKHKDTIYSVAGFHKTKNGLPNFTGYPGIMIPVKDPFGAIQGFQIRLDDPNGEGKYRWFSSKNYEGGTSSGTPLHLANYIEPKYDPEKHSDRYNLFRDTARMYKNLYEDLEEDDYIEILRKANSANIRPITEEELKDIARRTAGKGWRDSSKEGRLWITEGALKADISSLRLNEPVIGIAGVTCWKEDELINMIESIEDVKEVVIAFDADLEENKHVRLQRNKLGRVLLNAGFKVKIAEWNIDNGKGLDDLLVNGHTPEISDFRPPIDEKTTKTEIKIEKQENKHEESYEQDDKMVQINDYEIGIKVGVKRVPINELWKEEKESRDAKPCVSTNLVDELRNDMESTIEDYIIDSLGITDSPALLIRGFQGVGKTTTSLNVADKLWKQKQIRPIYSAPRHDLLEQAIEKIELEHILPRAPREEDEEPLCPYWEIANTIAEKRWSVIKHLCVKDICPHNPETCPYYMQYLTPFPCSVVHQILFVPKHTDMLLNFEDEEEGLSKNFVILDEPNIGTFIEKVEINTNTIKHSIDKSWNIGEAKFLTALDSSLGILQHQMERDGVTQLQGKEAVSALLSALGENSDELISDASKKQGGGGWKFFNCSVIVDDPVRPKKKLRIWLSDNKERYFVLYKANAEVISGNIVAVKEWYAEEIGLLQAYRELKKNKRDWFENKKEPAASDSMAALQACANALPLNFINDLLDVLKKESQNLVIEKGFKGKASLRMNLFRPPEVSTKTPLVVLDPDIPKELLSILLDREVKIWDTPAVSSDTEVIQVVDGLYGISTLWNKKQNHPKQSFFRLYPLIKKQIEDAPNKTLLVTWKVLADWLRDEQERGNLSKKLVIAHFGALEGLKDYNDFQQVLILGAPQISWNQVEELAHAIYPDHDLDTSSSPQWRKYNYKDSDGNQYSVEVKDYNDERLRQIAYLFREAEIIQCARRIRDLLSEGKKIVLLTNLPMDRLWPTRLTTVDELKEEYGLADEEKISAKQFVEAKVRGIIEAEIRKSLADNGEIAAQFVTQEIYRKIMDGQDHSNEILEQCNPSTIKRYIRDSFNKLASFYNLDFVKISIPCGGGTTHFNAYAIGEVDPERAKQQYRRWKVTGQRPGEEEKDLCTITTEELGDFIAEEIIFEAKETGLSPPQPKDKKSPSS